MEFDCPAFNTAPLLHVDGLLISPITGEIFGHDDKPSIYETPYNYSTPVMNRFTTKADRARGFQLDPNYRLAETKDDGTSNPGNVVVSNEKSGRGPKPKVLINPLARHIQVADTEAMGWVDDYVHGACCTVGGRSNGRLNASPADVRRVCMLDTISTDSVQAIIRNHEKLPVSKPHARRIAQIARFAIGGISHYLHRNPAIKKILDYEVGFAASYHQQPIYQEAA